MSETGLEASPYDLMGGADAVRRLARRFYEVMGERADAAAIRAMHAEDLSAVSEKLTGFLTAWLGGPRDYFAVERPCIMGLHRSLPIGAAERDQWLACMDQAMVETGVPEPVREKVAAAFARMANAMRSV